MNRSPLLAALLVASLAGPSAATETLCYVREIPALPTNWTVLADLQRFQPKLGVLTSISIQVSYSLIGSVRLESTDAAPTVIQTTLQAAFILQHPDSTTLAIISPQANFNDSTAPFDGTIDFAGPSGVQHLRLTAASTQSFTTTSASDRALFTGDGSIDVPVSVFAASYAAASGNVVTEFTSAASALVQVCYTYETGDERKGESFVIEPRRFGAASSEDSPMPDRTLMIPRTVVVVATKPDRPVGLSQLRRSIGTYGRSVGPV